MELIPDAPWIREPERYIELYYGKPVYLYDAEEAGDDMDMNDEEGER